jgi:hypothetical protein
MKGLFLPTKKFKTCLGFDLTIEYVSRSLKSSDDSYEILSIFPNQVKKVSRKRAGKIEIKFNKPVTIDDLINNEYDIKRICYLQNLVD